MASFQYLSCVLCVMSVALILLCHLLGPFRVNTADTKSLKLYVRGLLEKYPTFGREKETGLLGALDT